MELRIQRHQQQRPDHWIILEQQTGIAAKYRSFPPSADLVLLDCVTVLISNIIPDASGSPENPDELAAEVALKKEIKSLLELIAEDKADWILVRNEVGSGLVPPCPVGRIYRDLVSWANRRLAAASQKCYLTISGKTLDLHKLAVDLDTFFRTNPERSELRKTELWVRQVNLYFHPGSRRGKQSPVGIKPLESFRNNHF